MAKRITPTEKYAEYRNRIYRLEKYVSAQANGTLLKFPTVEFDDRHAGYTIWEPFVIPGEHPDDTTCGVIATRPNSNMKQKVHVGIFEKPLLAQLEELNRCRVFASDKPSEQAAYMHVMQCFGQWAEAEGGQAA